MQFFHTSLQAKSGNEGGAATALVCVKGLLQGFLQLGLELSLQIIQQGFRVCTIVHNLFEH